MVFLHCKFKYLFAVIGLIFLFAIICPIIANAACTQCANGDNSIVCCGNEGQPPCTFEDMFCLIQKIINFILFILIPPLAVIWFAYAGFTILTAAGNPSKVKQGKDMITYAFLGMLLAYSAWLLVYWFVSVIGGEAQAPWLLNFFSH